MYFMLRYLAVGGPGSSVGIATDYGLDGPGSNPVCFETWWERDCVYARIELAEQLPLKQ